MSLITKLPQIIEESKKKVEDALRESSDYVVTEKIGEGDSLLALGDNMSFMRYLLNARQMKGKINLVYIDPPFFSKTNYGTEIKIKSEKIKGIPVIKQRAYYDLWEDGMEDYLKMLIPRLYLIKDLLAEDGCLWVHLDWHSAHYVKVILDEIFGEKNFINEVIWNYKSGGVSKNRFARKHDTLLFYGKSSNYYFKAQQEKSYNRGFKPYRFKGVAEYKDEQGWYTMVNMKDVWQINMVGRTSAERTGYATQKPEELIERILESCTRENDICADFFGGSGTLAATASKMNRRWISCDLGRLATLNTQKRLVAGSPVGFLHVEETANLEQKSEFRMEINLQPLEISDKTMLSLKLQSYKLKDLSGIPVEEKYVPIIKEIIKKDSLQLIDYWSVDFNYDGIAFKPDLYFSKDNKGIQLSLEKLISHMPTIAVRVVDIFGNSNFAVYNLDKSEF